MEKKICNKCNIDKSLNEFPFKNKNENIRHGSCIECWKEIRKISYEKNKKTTLIRNKKNKKKNRSWYINYKSTLKCSKCPENHPSCLDFHHEDPTIKEVEISRMINSTSSLETIKKEIDKCIILCANCHRKHHYNENK